MTLRRAPWKTQADRIVADARGRRAEDTAAAYLAAQGYDILARRVKTPRGEVDLIATGPAEDGRGITLFVEVKWRARAEDLAFAIDQRRLTRVAMAAEILSERYVPAGQDWRIDVILLAPGHDPHHIANAWMP